MNEIIKPFEPGDVVVLKTHEGRRMVVGSVYGNNAGCWWHDNNGCNQWANYESICLDLVTEIN